MPTFGDYRGGGLRLLFAENPRKPGGWYDVPAFVESMRTLYGNLSDNRGEHHWHQFFDDHVGQ